MTKDQKAKTRYAIDCVASALHAEEYGLPDEDVRKAITQASYILDDVISQLGGKKAEIVPFPTAVSAADESMPDDNTEEDSNEESYQKVKARREAALTPSAKKWITARALAEETACAYETVCGWCREKHLKPYYKGFRLTEEEALAFKHDIGWEK